MVAKQVKRNRRRKEADGRERAQAEYQHRAARKTMALTRKRARVAMSLARQVQRAFPLDTYSQHAVARACAALFG